MQNRYSLSQHLLESFSWTPRWIIPGEHFPNRNWNTSKDISVWHNCDVFFSLDYCYCCVYFITVYISWVYKNIEHKLLSRRKILLKLPMWPYTLWHIHVHIQTVCLWTYSGGEVKKWATTKCIWIFPQINKQWSLQRICIYVLLVILLRVWKLYI